MKEKIYILNVSLTREGLESIKIPNQDFQVRSSHWVTSRLNCNKAKWKMLKSKANLKQFSQVMALYLM